MSSDDVGLDRAGRSEADLGEADAPEPGYADAGTDPDPAARDAEQDLAVDAPARPRRPRGGRRRAEKRGWFHRGHPVFTPLAGFFTGVLSLVVILGALGWVLRNVLDVDLSENPRYFFYALGALLVIDIALLVVPRTRRFAKYMLAALVTTPIVVGGVGALTLYLLLKND